MAAQPRRSNGSREHGESPERPIHGLSMEAPANKSFEIEKNRRADDYEINLEAHRSARSNNMSTSPNNLVSDSIEPSTPETRYNDGTSAFRRERRGAEGDLRSKTGTNSRSSQLPIGSFGDDGGHELSDTVRRDDAKQEAIGDLRSDDIATESLTPSDDDNRHELSSQKVDPKSVLSVTPTKDNGSPYSTVLQNETITDAEQPETVRPAAHRRTQRRPLRERGCRPFRHAAGRRLRRHHGRAELNLAHLTAARARSCSCGS